MTVFEAAKAGKCAVPEAFMMVALAAAGAFADIKVSDGFLHKLAYVESRCDPNAHNKGSGAYGIYQIRMPYLSDANEQLGTDYTLEDMFDEDLAAEVVRAYLSKWGARFAERHGRPPTDEELARIHNGGPRGAERNSTLEYAKLFRNAPEGAEDEGQT